MPTCIPYTMSIEKIRVPMHEREGSHQVKQLVHDKSDFLRLNRQLSQLMRALEDNDRDVAKKCLAVRADSFSELMHLAKQNRLLGYLHCLLEDNDLIEFVGPKVRPDLEAGYADQKARSEKNLSLIRSLVERFEETGIDFLTMKGLYLSQRFFGGIDRRFTWDLDILVRPSSLDSVLAVCREIGLHGKSRVGIDPTNRIWGIHAIEVTGEAGSLDLHFSLRNLPGIRFENERVWRDSKKVTILDLSLPAVSDEDNLVICTVGFAADLQTGHHDLRKLWTVYRILRDLDATMSWDSFFSRRHDEGTLKMVINTFALCLHLIAAKGDCPRLAAILSARDDLIFIRNRQSAEIIFARPRQHIANRLLFARMLPVSALGYGVRWLFTLPVRLLHYR